MPLSNFYALNTTEHEHALSVGYLCHFMALRLGYGERMSEKIQIAGFYHDIGKMCVSREILYKTSPLTALEYEQIRLHTDYGFILLSKKDSEICTMIAQVSLNHHERLDGSGYHGKKEHEIGDVTKIVMIADVFDALISKRCYKPAYSIEKIQYIMEKEMRGKLCGDYVNVLKKVLENQNGKPEMKLFW